MAFLGASAPRWVRRRAILRALLVAAVALLGMAGSAPAQTTQVREYQLKAVFLYNFAEFVVWPPETFPEAQSPLVIGILGRDPFGAYLDEAVQNERVNNRPLAIQRYRTVDEVKGCQILFISISDSAELERALVMLKGQSILTVSDSDSFSRLGGMIRFVKENNRIRLRINLGAAKAAGLTISSKLLRPAEIISMRREGH